MFVCPVPKISQVMMPDGAAELHIAVDLLWHNRRRVSHRGRFTLWHNGRRPTTQLCRFTLCGTTAAELHTSIDLLCGITAAELNNQVSLMHAPAVAHIFKRQLWKIS